MNRIARAIAPLALAVALAGPAAATDTAKTAAASAHAPLLWKVSDRDNSLYLLGSIHLLKKEDYPLSPDVDAAFDDAEHVMFEVDLPSMKTPETQAKFMTAMGFSDGRKLGDVLSAETRDKLDAMLKSSGASFAQVEGMEPWALNLTLVMGVFQALGFSADAGVDMHIEARARAAGKPISALETIDDQLRALDGAPIQEQIAGLEKFVSDPADTVKTAQLLHSAWLSGDAGTLDRELRAEMAAETPQSYKLLNVDRNDAWMTKLEARLQDHKRDDTLAVVGAMHLLGADGVVEKLRAKGYRVERICSSCNTGATAASAQ